MHLYNVTVISRDDDDEWVNLVYSYCNSEIKQTSYNNLSLLESLWIEWVSEWVIINNNNYNK